MSSRKMLRFINKPRVKSSFSFNVIELWDAISDKVGRFGAQIKTVQKHVLFIFFILDLRSQPHSIKYSGKYHNLCVVLHMFLQIQFPIQSIANFPTSCTPNEILGQKEASAVLYASLNHRFNHVKKLLFPACREGTKKRNFLLTLLFRVPSFFAMFTLWY